MGSRCRDLADVSESGHGRDDGLVRHFSILPSLAQQPEAMTGPADVRAESNGLVVAAIRMEELVVAQRRDALLLTPRTPRAACHRQHEL